MERGGSVACLETDVQCQLLVPKCGASLSAIVSKDICLFSMALVVPRTMYTGVKMVEA